ncbi:MAG TPA: serine/threonine-protein kinase, partial [Candidatus Acidoferrum sp.]|nr:serine/threonine-protein kinase [Candidatus Acidoferrum sp.]
MKPDAPKLPDAEADAPATDSERSMRTTLERQLGGMDSRGETFTPPTIPDHVLLHRIGSGAYGEVWLARSALGTLRAVKIVYRARFEDERPYEREFHGILKYEPISRTNEGLVQVLHVGRNDEAGCFYYVMELADGVEGKVISETVPEPTAVTRSTDLLVTDYFPRTLRSELRQHQRLPLTDAAQLTLRLVSALQHLHARGLVHRDIKPSNVIFVNGQPKLADIGLVAGAGDSRSFVGTEGFIPPEGPGTVQADIYSLGKLLYELATGRDRMDFPQLLPVVSGGSPCTRPDDSLLELNEIMTRACAPEAKQRYATATEMQAELNLFLAGHSLRQTRYIERNLVRLKRFAVIVSVCLSLAGVALWFSNREERHARERANAEAALRLRAEVAEHETQRQLFTALLEHARGIVRSSELGHRVRALDALRRAAAISNTAELRREVLAAFALPDVRFKQEWLGGDDVTCAQFDPGFTRLAVSRGESSTEILSGTDFKTIATLPVGAEGGCFRTLWSADGRHLLVKRDQDGAGNRSVVEVWEVARERRILLARDVPRDAMTFHPSLPRLALGTIDGPV